jgi:hypothetical protein
MLLGSIVLATLLGHAPTASDPRAQAQQRWDQADALASEGRHDEAVADYALAWQDLHAPAILYSWAQSERLRGHCTEAAALYERFVAEGQTPPAAYDSELLRAQWSNMLANAERQRQACREPADAPTVEEPADAPTDPATPTKTEPEPPPVTTKPPPDDAPPPRSWRRDAVGWSLVATGAAGLLAGATLVGVASWEDGRAEGLGTHQDFREAIDRAVIEQRIGLALLGTGGALAIGGIVRLVVVARRERHERASLQLHPAGRGLVLRGRF